MTNSSAPGRPEQELPRAQRAVPKQPERAETGNSLGGKRKAQTIAVVWPRVMKAALEIEIEGCKQKDETEVCEQSLEKPVPEDCKVHPDDDDHHRDDVDHHNCS